MSARNNVFSAFASLLALTAFAAPIVQDDARKVAEAFVANDAIGSTILGGRTVDGLQKRDQLWIVALQPSGHIILSASDLAAPIVGFSENDFTEPDPESPAYTVLQGTSDKIRRLEESAATERDPKWDALLAPISSRKLLGAPSIDSPDTVIIPPFMTCSYNQWQPYNDFAPIHDASTDSGAYRGRCPCGCVATAAAQGFRHFRWPVRIDRVDSCNHIFKGSGNFPIRFDGHTPIDWDSLDDSYDHFVLTCVTNYHDGGYSLSYEPNYDLRGTVPEAKRFPIARLILWMDVLAEMQFASGGSSANYGTIASNASEWYTPGKWVAPTDESSILTDLSNEVPLQVRIPGHAVVCHGWAKNGSKNYMYLNYGWGGENDGYYDINSVGTDSEIKQVYVGHYPRAKPQLDPLPKVCGTSVTLNWHFPDFYTNKLSSFTVSAHEMGNVVSSFLDDFSSQKGMSSTNLMYRATHSSGWNGQLLYSDYSAIGTYTYSDIYTLTSASVLTVDILSYAALSATLDIQAKFNGGDWESLSYNALNEGFTESRETIRIYLGDHGGDSVQFRLVKDWGGVYYIDNNGNRVDYGYLLIDDFKLTSVLAQATPQTYSVGKNDRSKTLSGLTAGGNYTFTVTPNFSATPTFAGTAVTSETSNPVTTSIAGTRRTPRPGEQTFTSQTLSFSTTDTTGVWSYTGTTIDNTTILDKSRCSISANILGRLTTSSSLSFGWSTNNYYGNGNDTLSVVFIATDGTATTVWTKTNAANSGRQNVNVPLGSLAEKSGKIIISCNHSGRYYIGDQYGGRLYAPSITNVLVPSVPAVSWETEDLTALGTPEITKVETVAEGFYKGCGKDTTIFTVACSRNVTDLKALPSHLALVKDEDISVASCGGGKFNVSIKPSGVNESNYRSRMILTLEATDSNGTKAYKDLSLRFDEAEEEIADDGGDDEPIVVTIEEEAGGEPMTVTIPADWFETYWPGETDRSSLGTQDTDGDGIPNWQEYVCGTVPTNAEAKAVLECEMAFVEGGGVVVTLPEDARKPAQGYTRKIKESDDLREWSSIESGCETKKHFFKVVIEQE